MFAISCILFKSHSIRRKNMSGIRRFYLVRKRKVFARYFGRRVFNPIGWRRWKDVEK